MTPDTPRNRRRRGRARFASVLVIAGLASGLWAQPVESRELVPGRSALSSTDVTTNDDAGTDDAGTDGGEEADDGSEPEVDPEVEAQLREGAAVYSQICSSCHQPGGTGLSSQYPPLLDNPNVQDTDYVLEVINNGRSGEIEVNGEIFDGVMPSFSTLTDDETDAVIAYIQGGFVAPGPAADEITGPGGPVAGTELPALANMGTVVAYLLAAAVVALVLAPRLASANDRLNVPWLDAWLKTAAIVLAIIMLTVVVPDWVLKTTTVSKLSTVGQDVIGVGLWSAGLGLALWAMWYAHRESRL